MVDAGRDFLTSIDQAQVALETFDFGVEAVPPRHLHAIDRPDIAEPLLQEVPNQLAADEAASACDQDLIVLIHGSTPGSECEWSLWSRHRRASSSIERV